MDDIGNEIGLVFRIHVFYNELRKTCFVYRLVFVKSLQFTNDKS